MHGVHMTPKCPAHLLELSYWWLPAPGDLLRTPETRPQSWVLDPHWSPQRLVSQQEAV